MKIEIELQEVEKLKQTIKVLEEKLTIAEIKLEAFDEKQIDYKIKETAYNLFNNYMGLVFRELGFGKWNSRYVDFNDDVEHWLGKRWYDTDKVSVEVRAVVSNKFKAMLLLLGVKSSK
jgi:hypothetical protein